MLVILRDDIFLTWSHDRHHLHMIHYKIMIIREIKKDHMICH